MYVDDVEIRIVVCLIGEVVVDVLVVIDCDGGVLVCVGEDRLV